MTEPDTAPMGLEEIARLEAIARAATPGPWDVERTPNEGSYGSGDDTYEGFSSFRVENAQGRAIVDTLNSETASVREEYDEDGVSAWDEVGQANAAHIAAFDPPTVLRLLAAATQGAELGKHGDAIASYDDGSEVHLSSNSGGAHKLGAWGTLSLTFLAPDGSETHRSYTADDAFSQPTPALSPDAGAEARAVVQALLEAWPDGHLPAHALCMRAAAVVNGPTPPPVAAEPAPHPTYQELDDGSWVEPAPQAEGAEMIRPPPHETDRVAMLSAPAADAGTRELREALEPFARVAEVDIGETETDEDIFQQANARYCRAPRITVGHMRRALAALTRAGGEKGGADV